MFDGYFLTKWLSEKRNDLRTDENTSHQADLGLMGGRSKMSNVTPRYQLSDQAGAVSEMRSVWKETALVWALRLAWGL